MTKLSLLQSLLPVLVPVALALIKALLPKLPKMWIPILAPLLGALAEILCAGISANIAVSAALGSAGVGVREIVDQLRKQSSAGSGPAAGSLSGVLMLLPLLSLPVLPGCSTSQDAALYKAVGTTEASVDVAMVTWGGYVRAQRSDPGADASKLAGQENTVRSAFTLYRATVNTLYDARSAFVGGDTNQTAALRLSLAACQAAGSNLVAIINAIVPPKQ